MTGRPSGKDQLVAEAIQLEAVSAGGDAAVIAAWGSPQTRQRLAGYLAALASNPTARTSA